MWFFCIRLGACWYLWGWFINPWVWFCMQHPGIYLYHVFLHLESVGGRHWRMPILLSRPETVPRSPSGSLSTSPVLTLLYSVVPVQFSWPALYLYILRWVRGFSFFRRKDERKRFPKSFSPLQWTRLSCPRWRDVEISTLVGLHVPLRRNSPEDISPLFRLSCWCSSPTPAYALSANQVYICHHWCNSQDNRRPCTYYIRDMLWTLFHPQDSPGITIFT